MLPIIMIFLCLIGGGFFYFFMKKGSKKPQTAETSGITANEFINVRDIHGNFLYTGDGLALCYLKITPVSIDLYSKSEKKNMVRMLTAEMSGTAFPFKFIAVSRPVDISPLVTELYSLLHTADTVQKELLTAEIAEMSDFALSGEIVERQFYAVLWDKQGDERELLNRAKVFAENFSVCKIKCEILNQQEIVRLCNLVNNPEYTHLEDSNFEAAIPLINGGVKL